MTLVVWTLVFLRTITMLRNGQIFESPCIEEIDIAKHASKEERMGPAAVALDQTSGNGNGSGAAAWSGTTFGSMRVSQSL